MTEPQGSADHACCDHTHSSEHQTNHSNHQHINPSTEAHAHGHDHNGHDHGHDHHERDRGHDHHGNDHHAHEHHEHDEHKHDHDEHDHHAHGSTESKKAESCCGGHGDGETINQVTNQQSSANPAIIQSVDENRTVEISESCCGGCGDHDSDDDAPPSLLDSNDAEADDACPAACCSSEQTNDHPKCSSPAEPRQADSTDVPTKDSCCSSKPGESSCCDSKPSSKESKPSPKEDCCSSSSVHAAEHQHGGHSSIKEDTCCPSTASTTVKPTSSCCDPQPSSTVKPSSCAGSCCGPAVNQTAHSIQALAGCYDACCDSRSAPCWLVCDQNSRTKAVVSCKSGCCDTKPAKPIVERTSASKPCADACCGPKPVSVPIAAPSVDDKSCKTGCCKPTVVSVPLSNSCSVSITAIKLDAPSATSCKDACCKPKPALVAAKPSKCADSCCDSKPAKPVVASACKDACCGPKPSIVAVQKSGCQDACCGPKPSIVEKSGCQDACCGPKDDSGCQDDCCTGPPVESINYGLEQARRLFKLCCDLCWNVNPGECCGKACCSVSCCLLKAHRQMLDFLKREGGGSTDKPSAIESTLASTESVLEATVFLSVKGLDCADCSASVEKQINKLKGILNINVATMTGRTKIVYQPDQLDPLTEKEQKLLKASEVSNSFIPESIAVARFIRAIDQIGFSTSVAQSSVFQIVEFTIESDQLLPRSPSSADVTKVVSTEKTGDVDNSFMFDKALVFAMLALQGQPGVLDGSVVHVVDPVIQKRTIRCQIDRSLTGPRKLVKLMQQTSLNFSMVPISQSNAPTAKVTSSLEEQWRSRFFMGLIFCIPIVVIAFILPAVGGSSNKSMNESVNGSQLSVGNLLLFLFTTPIQLFLGWPLTVAAYRGIRYARAANADLLVALSSSIAYLYSFITIILQAANVQDNDSIGEESSSSGNENQFFETSAILLTLIALGRYLEVLAKGKTSDIIKKLDQMTVASAILLVDYPLDGTKSSSNVDQSLVLQEEEVSMDLIERDDVIKVLPGTRCPTDGEIVFGTSNIDQSLVTGESIPVTKRVGDMVYSGTINQSGVIHMRVTKTANENTLSVISHLVRDAQSSQPTIQRVADRIAGVFVPFILVMSLCVFFVWLAIAETGSVSIGDSYNAATFALRFAIVTLVISCPCALGLATPTAVMAGSGVGAKRGVIFKSGEIIERCAHVKTVIFDKTGTLTMGKPTITHVQFINPSESQRKHDQATLWQWLQAAESGSDHPLAHALIAFCKEQLNALAEQQVTVDSSSEIAGKGVRCFIGDHEVLVGSRSFMTDNNIDIKSCMDVVGSGQTVVCFAVDNHLSIVIHISDALRPEACAAVEALGTLGIDVWLCSGDSQQAATEIGAQAGIHPDRVLGDQLPQDKAELVSRLQAQGLKVSMVGDGINDSVALARADVGIAVAKGTDIAAEAAHVILMKDDLRDVLLTFHLARRTFQCIRFNFLWAFLYNLFAIPLAVGVFYPAGEVAIPPALAGVAELLSSLPVVLFSLMLRFYTPLTAGVHEQVFVENAPVTIVVH